MQAHQERVVTEKKELDEKLERLTAFISGEIFPTLPEDEQDRMKLQADLMGQLSAVLGKRIAAFSV